MMKNNNGIVVLSGGMDSTIAMFWAMASGIKIVHAISFNYGQRHVIELNSAEQISKLVRIPHMVINISSLRALSDSALLNEYEDISASHKRNEDLPASFVPGRNLLFLTLAAAFAYKINASHIITGVCQTDYSGYPDCRQNTIEALQVALNLGMDSQVRISAPLMWLTKAESLFMVAELPKELREGCVEALAYTHTCYNGTYPPCNECPSCKLRKAGFDKAGLTDPLLDRYEREVTESDLE